MCVDLTAPGQAFPYANEALFSSFCDMSISNLAQVKDVPILMHSNRLYCSSMFSLSASLFCTLQDMWCVLQLNDYFNPFQSVKSVILDMV